MRGFSGICVAAAMCAGATAQVLPSTIRISDEVAPPGGMVQMKVLLTSPMPITSGGMYMDMSAIDFSSIDGIALFDSGGDVNGAAVVDGGKVSMRLVSPKGTFGATIDYPVMTVAMRMKTTAQKGQAWPVELGTASYWQNLLGSPSLVELKAGSATVGGSVSVTNVLPGGGMLPAGGTIRVLGVGFNTGTKLTTAPLRADQVIYVSPTEMRVVIKTGGLLDGLKIIVSNPDKSSDTYFSYLRGVPVGQSNRSLLEHTVPAFSINTMYDAQLPSTISPLLNPDYFTALALQNPNATDASVTVEAHTADGTLTGATTLALPSGGRITRDAAELFGAPLGTGAYLRVKSATPVQAMGLLGNETTKVVLPLAMTVLSAGPSGPPADPGVKNPTGGGSGSGGGKPK